MTINDVKIVADNIDDFIEVPDSVKRLRKAVLTLAVSGKLVPQDKKENTAEELYAKLLAKPIIESAGRKKKTSGTSPLTTNDIPFEIPKSWKWVRLGEIVSVQTGTLDANASSSDGEYPFFTCADEPLRINRYAYDCECVLLAGNGNFNVKYYKGKFEAYQRTYIIEAADEEVFVPYIYLLVQMQTDRFKSTSLGSAMPYIRLGYITEAVVSLPPFLEQKRIVQKVEELLNQLDELEVKKRERDETRTRLARSAMQSLGKSESRIAFDNLSELLKTPADLLEFESALLNLAVTGKLTPQDSKEGSAVDLLKTVARVKQELVDSKELKSPKQNNVSVTIRDFLLPESWMWAKGYEIFFITKLAGFEYTKHIKLSDSGEVPVVRAQNVRKYFLDKSSLKYIDKDISVLLQRSALTKPALLVTFIGAGIGEVALFSEKNRWHLAPNVAKMELFEKCDSQLDLKYFCYYLASGYGQREIFKHMKETAQPSLSMGTIRDIDYPIPPTKEQRRIVKKVEEIMVLIDRLKQVIGK